LIFIYRIEGSCFQTAEDTQREKLWNNCLLVLTLVSQDKRGKLIGLAELNTLDQTQYFVWQEIFGICVISCKQKRKKC